MLLKIALFHSFLWLTLFYCKLCRNNQGFPGGSAVKNPPANAEDEGDLALIPGSGRPPGVGNGNSLQYSCLENPMDKRSLTCSIGSQKIRHDLVTKPARTNCKKQITTQGTLIAPEKNLF